ncbi:MAG: RluA family pseudouridine synthase [Polyangiaceae bacterium]
MPEVDKTAAGGSGRGIELLVTESLDGARLDKATVALAEGTLSRAKVKRAIDAGEVRVNGRRRPKGALVAKGDRITLEGIAAESDESAVADPSAPLEVRFESSAVVVVDKPAGQPTAPLRPGETGTLANALLARYPELAGIGYSPREPGLLHRLDTDTSGLVVVARSAAAFEKLKSALKEGRITKHYLLVCEGEGLADDGTIAFPIASHPKDQRRVLACIHPRDVMRNAPRPASTAFRVRERGGKYALVEVEVSRALRHQIRSHFAAIDHPLVGDALYGGPAVEGLARHALHASRVAYDGDGDAALRFAVESPLPDELARLVAS